MPRNFKVYLEDILEATAKIKQFTAGFTLEKFSADTKTFDAVIRRQTREQTREALLVVTGWRGDGRGWRRKLKAFLEIPLA